LIIFSLSDIALVIAADPIAHVPRPWEKLLGMATAGVAYFGLITKHSGKY
jgi:formylmethanofuran dehydrogenase subunit B